VSWCSPMAVNFIVTVDRIRKSDPKENVLIASTFGIVSIVTRRNNVDEAAASWLIEKLDQVELGNRDGRADGSNSNKIENEILAATSNSSTNGNIEMKDEAQVNFTNETLSQDEVHVENKNGAKM